MTTDGFVVLMIILFVAATIGFYVLFERLARKWLDVEDVPIPFPAVMRWTILAGAVHATFILGWIGSMFV